jgi:hypothetical protein
VALEKMKKRQETVFSWQFEDSRNLGLIIYRHGPYKVQFLTENVIYLRWMNISQLPHQHLKIVMNFNLANAIHLSKNVMGVEQQRGLLSYLQRNLSVSQVEMLDFTLGEKGLTLQVITPIDRCESFCDGAIRWATAILHLANCFDHKEFIGRFQLIQRTWVLPAKKREWMLLEGFIKEKHGLTATK